MGISSLGPGGLRLALALMVVVEHISRLQIGKVAVMAFFVLSGYWVTRVFEERYAQNRHSVLSFYVARFLRIWPLFLVVFLLTALLLSMTSADIPAMSWVSIPILGVATHGIDLIGVSWSLDIEIQFYLLVPLLVLILHATHTRAHWSLFVAGVLFIWATGAALSYAFNVQTVLFYLPLFIAGALIYRLDIRPKTELAAVSLGFFALAALWAVMLPETRSYLLYGSGSKFYDKLHALVWAIYLLPFIAFNLRQKSGWLDRHMGNLSYTVYLVHFPLIRLGRELAGRPLSDWEKPIFIGLTLAISILIYVLIDVRLETLRRKIIRYMHTVLSFRVAKG